MRRGDSRPAIETVEFSYVDFATGEARGEPTVGERIEMAQRLMTAAARSVFGQGVSAVWRERPAEQARRAPRVSGPSQSQ